MSLPRRVVKPLYLHLAWYHPTDAQQWKVSVLKACHVYWSNTKRLGMAQTPCAWHTHTHTWFRGVHVENTLWNVTKVNKLSMYNFLSISLFSSEIYENQQPFLWLKVPDATEICNDSSLRHCFFSGHVFTTSLGAPALGPRCYYHDTIVMIVEFCFLSHVSQMVTSTPGVMM